MQVKMTTIPLEAQVFSCQTIPGCHHGRRYACTPRVETAHCDAGEATVANGVKSRGTCKRVCHFEALCAGYSWHVTSGVCTLCYHKGVMGDVTTTWAFEAAKDLRGLHVVEWHHGWHTGAILSAWTGKIDLVKEGYISPRPMEFEETHILL